MCDIYLAHYGVKGMRWGKRKNADQGPSKSQQIKSDRKAAKGELNARKDDVQNARREMNSSRRGSQERVDAMRKVHAAEKSWRETYERSKQKTGGEKAAEATVTIAAAFAPAILMAGGAALSSAASSRQAARGAAAAANLMADSRGLTSYRTIALAFDAVSGTWK